MVFLSLLLSLALVLRLMILKSLNAGGGRGLGNLNQASFE